MELFHCPYLGGAVEFSHKREEHIRRRHPDLLPAHRRHIALTLADPDRVQISPRDLESRLFTRWHNDLSKYVVVVVVIDTGPRYRIITARIGRRAARGETEWRRS